MNGDLSEFLTPKQWRFVDEYLVDLNATAAAIRAGYSARTARSTGSANLTKPAIARELERRQALRAERVGVTADSTIEELAAVAFADLGDFLRIDEAGALSIDLSKLPRGATRALVEATVETRTYRDFTTRRVKIRMGNKVAALELLGRHLGMFPNRHEHAGKDGGPIEVKEDREQLTAKVLGLLADMDTKRRAGEIEMKRIPSLGGPASGGTG